MGMVVKNNLHRVGRGLAAAFAAFLALAGHAPDAAADWAGQCFGCHGGLSGVTGARINAAGAGPVIQRAIDLGLMAVAGAVNTTAIAGEINSNNTPYSQTVNFNFNQTANITVNKLVIPSNFIDRLEQSSAVAGTNLPVLNSTTFSYNHPATNCTQQVLTLNGREGAAGVVTSGRTVTININAPSLTATSASYALTYSTSAQTIDVGPNFNSSPAGAGPAGTMNFVGSLSPNLGSRAATGSTTFTYASSATTYAPTVTQQYTIDGLTNCGTSNTATATINVGLPPAPAVQSFARTVPAVGATVIDLDTPVARISGVILSNPAGTYNVVASQPTAPGSGTSSVSGHQITYTPPGGAFTGPTTITYTKDGPGGTSNVGTITLNVTAAPVVSDSSATTSFNTPIAIDLTGSIAGTSTSVSVSGVPVNGTAMVTGPAQITFTPTPGFFGAASFQFTATGPGGSSPPPAAIVSVTVDPPAPTVSNITANVNFSTPTPVDVAAGINAVPVTSVNAFAPVNGTITGVVGTVVTFNPTPGYIGPASFQFTATNVGGTSAPAATANLTVLAPPPPVASNLSVQVMNIGGTPINLAGSITGFVNSIMIVGTPTQGTLSVNGFVVTYTPIASTTTTDTFSYVAVGPGGTSAPATVTVNPTSAPITPNFSVTVPFNTVTTIDIVAAILGTFSSYSITSSPANGIVLVRGNVVTYTPNIGYFGPDSFTYQATGTGGTSTPGTITLTVNPPLPQVVSQTVNVSFNTATQIDLSTLVAGVATSYAIVTAPSNGTLTISGSIATYTPAPGYFGPDSFTFRAINAAGTSNTATVNINVGSLKPTAGPASMVVPLNTPTSKDLSPFIIGSGVLGVSIAKDGSHGTVTVNGKVVTYTPKHNYFGPDSFTYIAYGNLGESDPGTVSVTVTGRPDPREDGTVRALIDAQGASARRFSRAQISNFTRRMETLHRGPDLPAPEPVAKPAAPAPTSRAPAPDPRLAALGRAGSTDASTGASAGGTSPLPAPLLSSLISLATSHSLSLNGATALRDGTGVWMGGLGQFGNVDATGERSGARFSTDGLSIGADRRFSERLVLGLGVGYARDETRIGADGSKSKARGGSIAAYGSFQPTGNTFIDALIGFGRLDFDSDRYVSAIDLFAVGQRKGDQVFGSISGGYEWRRDGVLISPYGRLDFSSDKLKSATESGADQYNLAYAGQTQRSTQAALGIRAEAQHETDFGRATPRIRAEYRREFSGDRNASVSYADLFGGPEYSVSATGVSRNSLLLGIGSDFSFNGGLKLGIDYQNERSSGTRNVQSIRFLVTQELDGKGLPAFRFTNRLFEKPITIDAGYNFDDNVTRGRLDSEKRSDASYSLGINQSWPFALTERTRLLVTGMASGDKFRLYDGLGRASAGLQGEYQFRTSAAFDAITWTAVGRAWYDKYESHLRTGNRYFLGANARRSFTDKIDLFVELGGNVRHGNSEVFNVKDYVGRFNVDYSLGPRGVVYFGGEYRKGDTFASGFASLTSAAIADVAVLDDAFEGGEFFAYRIDARAWIGTLGWNYPLGPRDSIDFSYRHAQATPTLTPSFDFPGALRYKVNQYSIVYLMRF